MPYVFKEVLDEEEVEADVVTREDYDAVIAEKDEIMTQRDDAITRAETAEAGWAEARNKYADAFLSSPARAKEEQAKNVKKDSTVTSFSQLFEQREGY